MVKGLNLRFICSAIIPKVQTSCYYMATTFLLMNFQASALIPDSQSRLLGMFLFGKPRGFLSYQQNSARNSSEKYNVIDSKNGRYQHFNLFPPRRLLDLYINIPATLYPALSTKEHEGQSEKLQGVPFNFSSRGMGDFILYMCSTKGGHSSLQIS